MTELELRVKRDRENRRWTLFCVSLESIIAGDTRDVLSESEVIDRAVNMTKAAEMAWNERLA